jgi:hypothetical protein
MPTPIHLLGLSAGLLTVWYQNEYGASFSVVLAKLLYSAWLLTLSECLTSFECRISCIAAFDDISRWSESHSTHTPI